MSEIVIFRDDMVARMRDLLSRVDDADKALAARPTAPEGGIAAAMIGLIAAAGAEAVGASADASRALAAITIDVLEDSDLSETQIGQEFSDLRSEMDTL